MKLVKPTYFAAMTIALSTLGTGMAQAQCGNVTISEMNWASAQAAARVDEFILKHGYGCDAETVPGDTVPTAASMTEKGRPDIAPELWMNTVKEQVDRAVGEGRLTIVGDVLEDPAQNAGEGWWIPRYMLKSNPELATIEGVKKNPGLFKDPEDPSKGRVVGCPAGWACQIITANLYKAFDMEGAGFNLVDPGSGAALAGAIKKAYNRGEGVLAYYWAPTSLIAELDLVRVELAPYNAKEFEQCIGVANCPDPKPNGFAVSEIKTVVATEFAQNNPEPMAYLKARVWSAEDFGKVLTYMEAEQADGQAAAQWFLKNHEAAWSKWVPADVAAKVKAAL
ncbi:MAG: glycine/betaine ABC transporter substrate-binding protein [Burkholderiaceae bacterium]|nr:glycine/betaine ABC transporter substrate-binding protein [Burkholderiaceae bacterium]MCD8516922.1 glycine/betaine ABC transporter substrate-binding protein [Burkholderiaceae bacterium]MCD8537559.1 glycine/betaine ABC transporter substrate-binding protein [Burkholderiaceae bacterium]MCD8565630.1 glycine/betaine ABC transporter substrate-binding protein [Burkholderiaceae bacterium]